MRPLMSKRLAATLKLALLGDCACLKTLGALSIEASAQGLTGAEIDVALARRSFEARADAAIAYACALKTGDAEALASAQERAFRLGLAASELEVIAGLSRQILEEART